ncbi:hypothetical protein EW146_g5683 [Bondarzewia mesenterica]|uniref:Ribosomal protein eL8/eL30/eS12/Gadd45 domain-containing protein n=1 Tax=Bondarzewia mesenterica TaxID=1095465 RepID=A0A4S4LRC4_9AGAM|nr:hypothetical protein EW146_g5683 [Bondarzewia mesenterica]
MAKDKSEKKKKTVTEPAAEVEDIEMVGTENIEKPKKVKEEISIPLEDLSPIAHPLAQKKLLKKLHKTIKKASKARQVKRGVKEVAKGIRKGEKGLLVLAADITPIDIISHLPVMSEEAQIPYVFVTSKEELGHASSTKRPTSCVMVCPDQKRSAKRKEGDAETSSLLSLIMSGKTKSAPAGITRKKSKEAAPSNDVAATSAGTDVSHAIPTQGSAKPDKAVYDAEQERIKGEIDALQAKSGTWLVQTADVVTPSHYAKCVVVRQSAVKEKISLVTKSGTGNDRRNALRAELDGLRAQQSSGKTTRNKVHEQLKSLQEGIQKKIKDLQAARSKTPFRTVEDVDAHIKNLDKQVESGSMKLADEKRALQEISQTRRARKTVEGFQAESDAIDADRARIDELKKQLDDPESKAISDRYDTIKGELDELKKESDKVYASRNKLFDERTALQSQLDSLFNEKHDLAQQYREANDRYWAKVNEDRARRAERTRAQRALEEEQKKKEVAERLREEASQPAFQVQIEDCQTLIDYLSGKSKSAPITSTSSKEESADEPKLDIRKVESGPQDGMVVRKKKGQDDEAYFVGGKGKKGKKGGAKANGNNAPSETSSNNFNIPFATLSALLSLSIPPPASAADVPRVVEDLKKKKAWFEANQARVTGEAIAKAEADIRRLTNGKVEPKSVPETPTEGVVPPGGGGENPAEPASTPKVTDLLDVRVSSEDIVDKLEEVKEQEGETA